MSYINFSTNELNFNPDGTEEIAPILRAYSLYDIFTFILPGCHG